jgi:putative ABC transport system permease protein
VLVEDGAEVKAGQPIIVSTNATLQLQVASREADTAGQINALENTCSMVPSSPKTSDKFYSSEHAMFRHYLTTAARNIVRHKLYSFINIAGLALGLACAILIILFIHDETSYDKWVPDGTRLYRLELTQHVPGSPAVDNASVPFPVGAAMQEEIPEVTAATRLRLEPITMTVGNRQFPEAVDVVDPNFLQVVRLPLVRGDPATVLMQPESLVLSEDTARKFFGNANPLGQTVTVAKAKCDKTGGACESGAIVLKVTGVLRNLPTNSQLVADVIMPNTSVADRVSQQEKQNWTFPWYYTYVTLGSGADPQAVIAKLTPILDRGMSAKLQYLQLNIRGSQVYEMHLTPFTDVHLSSARYPNNITPAGSWITVYGIATVGLLIVLVACFNFMNLATARAMLRAREISLRKCVGARRSQLMTQFLGESVLMAICSLVLALAIVEILLPAYDRFLERPIAFHYLGDWPLSLMIVGIAIAAGLIGGVYPALTLSSFRPAMVLRTNSSGRPGSNRLRTVLVVLQFAVSIGLGTATIVVYKQISFARDLDLGFHRSNIVVLNAAALTPSSRETLAQTLRSYPGVFTTALSGAVPFQNDRALGLVRLPGQPDVISVNRVLIGPDFPRLYGMSLVAGRLFSESREVDSLIDSSEGDSLFPMNEGHNILINVAAAARLGYTPQQAIGKTILYNVNHVNIVGVLGDVKFEGAREPVKPTVYFNDKSLTNWLSVRLNGRDVSATLASIDRTWRALAPATYLWEYFLSDQYGTLYRSDERQGVMFGVSVGIAIFIACLGLFGVAAFTAARRTKEIGIRKIFGARRRDILQVLLWQFSIPVLIANVIAWPVAYYYLHHWLESYAYRITLNPLYFFGAGLAALGIAWITIIAHSIHVALASPIDALRYE